MAANSFRKVSIFDKGYDVEEVDDFLRRAKEAYNGPLSTDFDENTVRNVAFHSARGGYLPTDIDDALDRLDAAFVHKRRAIIVADDGENAWLNATYQDAKSLYPRLLRPAGQRFRSADGWGYAKEEVDELIGRLAAYFDGKSDLAAREIREAVFSSAKGSKAYDEAVVDVYLERAASVLLSVE